MNEFNLDDTINSVAHGGGKWNEPRTKKRKPEVGNQQVQPAGNLPQSSHPHLSLHNITTQMFQTTPSFYKIQDTHGEASTSTMCANPVSIAMAPTTPIVRREELQMNIMNPTSSRTSNNVSVIDTGATSSRQVPKMGVSLPSYGSHGFTSYSASNMNNAYSNLRKEEPDMNHDPNRISEFDRRTTPSIARRGESLPSNAMPSNIPSYFSPTLLTFDPKAIASIPKKEEPAMSPVGSSHNFYNYSGFKPVVTSPIRKREAILNPMLSPPFNISPSFDMKVAPPYLTKESPMKYCMTPQKVSDHVLAVDTEGTPTPPFLSKRSPMKSAVTPQKISTNYQLTDETNVSPPFLAKESPMKNTGTPQKSISHVLTVDTKMKAIKDMEDEAEMRTPNSNEVCKECHRFTHEDDIEADEAQKKALAAWNEGAKPEDVLYLYKHKSHRKRGNDFLWIQCDECAGWYHFKCSKLEQYEYHIYSKFHCKTCEPTAGPSIEHEKIARHRYRAHLKEEMELPSEVGSEHWIKDFTTWESKLPAPTADEVVICEDGYEFESKFKKMRGYGRWKKVFLIKNREGLGMTMPEPGKFDLEDVVDCMGEDYEVDTIDVYRQETYSMRLSTFLRKIRDEKPRSRLYNFLSLEFSENYRMRGLVKPPRLVNELSMVNKLWPDEDSTPYLRMIASGDLIDYERRPRVAEFCLAGMGGSYTDFHIDFGGSSVWYHIYKGQKIFYIAEPTEPNLKAFLNYECHKNQTDWFGDDETLVKNCIKRVVIEEGQTLMVPAGWIHSVYTPVDSLVFGGNFLTVENLGMQMRVYKLEGKIRKNLTTDDKFYFPNYELVNWHYANNVILEQMREANDEYINVGESMMHVCRQFAKSLKSWVVRDEADGKSMEQGALAGYKEIVSLLEKAIKKQEKVKSELSGRSQPKRGRRSKEKRDVEFTPDGEEVDEYSPKNEEKKKRTKKSARLAVQDQAVPKTPTPVNTSKSEDTELQETTISPRENSAEPLTVSAVDLGSAGDLKMRLSMVSEEQKSAAAMFNKTVSSSGRVVRPKAKIRSYAGSRLEQSPVEEGAEDAEGSSDNTPTEAQNVFYHQKDKELEEAEAAERGEVPKSAKKTPKPKTPKAAAEPKEKKSKSGEATARQRLQKRMKMLKQK